MKSLNKLKRIRFLIIDIKRAYYVKFWGMNIHKNAKFSLGAKFDMTYPCGVHVGEDSYVATNAKIFTHDMVRGMYLDTKIGRNCFIGAYSIILPGITIGDGSVVGAGSVVTKDVPAGCIVAGNPAKIVRENIEVGKYGRLKGAQEKEDACLAKHRA